MDKAKYARVNVVGCSGAGKSTLAEAISNKLNSPLVELDQLFWKPEWNETSDEEMKVSIEKSLAGDQWVLAGNFNRFEPIKWQRVQTVVWVDMPFWTNFWQVTKRSIERAIHQNEIWEGTGCRESFKRCFFTRDSVILWMLQTHRKMRKRYTTYMKDPQYNHIQWVRLNNRKEVREFLEKL